MLPITMSSVLLAVKDEIAAVPLPITELSEWLLPQNS